MELFGFLICFFIWSAGVSCHHDAVKYEGIDAFVIWLTGVVILGSSFLLLG